jgi:hypothetical protein
MNGKHIIGIWILALASHAVFAEKGEAGEWLRSFLATDAASTSSIEKFESFVEQAEKKRSAFSSEKEFARYLFFKTHQKFLKHYEPNTSFGELMKTGRYNCLTGVALYAVLLDHFNIRHQVIETNYHIFIVATIDNQQVLLEATDPIAGFVDSTVEFEKRLAGYRANARQTPATKGVQYEFQFNLWETVSLEELTGLLYFNKAVEEFNQAQLENVVAYLTDAVRYRPSARLEEFSSLVIASVVGSELSLTAKQNLLVRLREVRKQSVQWMAASAGL